MRSCKFSVRSGGARRHLGCWRDKPRRAIAGGIRFRGSIAKCEQYARRHGYRVFAIQYGGECFTAGNAHQTYRKYGRAGNCRNGKGGGWAQNVYTVGGGHQGFRNTLRSNEGDFPFTSHLYVFINPKRNLASFHIMCCGNKILP